MRLGSRFHDLSIRGKLAWIGILASGSALLTASVAFVAYDFVFFRKAIVRGLERDAAIIGANSTAALEFQDPRAAESTLSALKAEPHVLGAAIYDEAGRLFALYARDAALFVPPAGLPADPSGHRFERGRVVLFQPIFSERRRIGSVYIEADLRERWQRLREFAGIVALVSLTALGVSVLISRRYEIAIARPVQDLAAAARAVSSQKDYSVRVPEAGRDELGLLVLTFNEMLARIQQRDAELQDARDGLERRVEERTQELQRELEERRRAEDEILRLNQELEAFTYSVSHDLRAPLRAVAGFSHILGEDHAAQLDESGLRYLRRIIEGARHMGVLIDDLLNLSRVGRTQLERQPTDLAALVQEVRRQLDPEGGDRRIDWRIEALPVVECDGRLIRQVFVNLLSNAVKYTRPRERGEIAIGAREQDAETILFVRDNGVGFDMKYVHKLFGVFQRLHDSDAFEGTGVGLATVQRIVHKHGGRIWAEALVDQGATFYFTLETARDGAGLRSLTAGENGGDP